MTDANTLLKIYKHNNRQRIETADLDAQTSIAQLLDEEIGWAALSASNCVVDGWHVVHDSATEFEVSRGAGLYNGRVLKDPANPQTQLVSLETNVSSDPRIDVIYCAGPQEVNTDSASKVLLSAYTRTPVAAEAVGTGDGSTKAFDLAHAGVDIRTLKVQVASVAVGGWNLSPGTGGGGEDQIIFGTAPASGAITADYTYESGGAEGSSSVSTRKTQLPEFLAVTGTPDPSPVIPATPNPNTDIVIAHVYIPGSWSGGAPTSIDNTVKRFFLHPDGHQDGSNPISPTPPNANAPRAGRISSLLRNMDQVYMGGRLRYFSDDTIELTAMWGTLGGYSVFVPDDTVSLTLQNASSGSAGYVDAIGWWYVYLSQVVDAQPGVAPALFVSQNPPDSRRREASTNSAAYVGAIYLTAYDTPVIRPFYTHGQWVYWQAPSALSLTFPNAVTPTGIQTHAGEIDVSAWCPPTGRLLNARVKTTYNPGSGSVPGDELIVEVMSHRTATALPDPRILIDLSVDVDGDNRAQQIGPLRAEDDEGTRYVNYETTVTVAYDTATADLYIQGYLDDYRTMDQDGNIPTIH